MRRRDFLGRALGVAAAAAVVDGTKLTRRQAETVVKKAAAVGPAEALAKFESSSTPGKFYEVRRGADRNIYCTCPAWKFQKKATADRTCKHIKQLTMAVRRAA